MENPKSSIYIINDSQTFLPKTIFDNALNFTDFLLVSGTL